MLKYTSMNWSCLPLHSGRLFSALGKPPASSHPQTLFLRVQYWLFELTFSIPRHQNEQEVMNIRVRFFFPLNPALNSEFYLRYRSSEVMPHSAHWWRGTWIGDKWGLQRKQSTDLSPLHSIWRIIFNISRVLYWSWYLGCLLPPILGLNTYYDLWTASDDEDTNMKNVILDPTSYL